MSNIFLIVEGQTEEKFYKTLFARQFQEDYFKVVIMPNKRRFVASKDRGGRVDYSVCLANVKRFISENSNSDLIVLIYDYYGLDKSFRTQINTEDSLTIKISSIKERLEKDINNRKFKFFLQVHEFESYLFSDIDILANHFDRVDSKENLEKILNEFNYNPELINDSRETAPSKRLEKIYPGFGKTVDGLNIIEKIGIPIYQSKMCIF